MLHGFPGDSTLQALPPDAQSPRAPDPDMATIGRLWTALLRHKVLFFTITFGFLALVIIATLLTPKTYTSTVHLIAGSAGEAQPAASDRTMLPVLNALVLESGQLNAETFAELLQESPVAQSVIDRLNLQMDTGTLLRHVAVKPIPNTAVLAVSVSLRNRAASSEVANAFAMAFADRERNLVRDQAAGVQRYLSVEIPQAKVRMKQTADALAAYQAKYGLIDVTSQTQTLVQRIATIDAKTDQVQQDRKQTEALLQSVQDQLTKISSTMPNQRNIDVNPTLATLNAQLADLDVQLATARQRYTSQHPAVIALQQQRQQVLKEISRVPSSVVAQTSIIANPLYQQLTQQSAAYRAQISGDEAALAQLAAQHKAMQPSMRGIPTRQAEFAGLQQQAKLASDVYTALQQKANDALIAQKTAISDVSITQMARPEDAAVSPSLRLNTILGLAVGLLLALGVVTVVEFFERRLHDESDVLRTVGLPVLASIPTFQVSGPKALPWMRSLAIESFLHLCTSLRLRNKTPIRKIAITSPEKGDGKSLIAFNLALAMSNVKPRVLLIDGDLRRPALHTYANVANERGLSDVLSGQSSLEESIARVSTNLDLLPSGQRSTNPVGLLESELFSQLLADVEQRYSMVVIDTPALVPVTDSIVIASKADATAVVVRAEATDERAVRFAVDQLRVHRVHNVLGVILNRTRAKMVDYSDYFEHVRPEMLAGGTERAE